MSSSQPYDSNSQKRDKFATVYTDASGNKKSWSWAFFARTCGRYHSGSGTVGHRSRKNLKIAQSNSAEMYAIYMAVKEIINVWPDVKGIFVNTDNKTCCFFFWPSRNNPGCVSSKKIYLMIQELLDGRWIRVKWVKGHQKSKNIRAYLNNKVDGMARRVEKAKGK